MEWYRRADPPPPSMETCTAGLLHRDFLINLFDRNTLAPAIGAEAEVDRRSHQVVDHHEDHRADIRPADRVRGGTRARWFGSQNQTTSSQSRKPRKIRPARVTSGMALLLEIPLTT